MAIEHLKPHQFQPGASGNPSGRPKNALTASTYSSIASKYLNMGQGALKAILEDPVTPAVDCTIIARIMTAMGRGESINDLLAYVVGKPVEKVQQEIRDWTKDFDDAPRENILKVLRDGTDK